MANILVNIEKGIEVAAEDILGFFSKAEKAAPGAVAALAVLLGAASKVVSDISMDAHNPAQLLSVSLTQQQWADIKSVWPDIVHFAAELGIKL
ncbi:MAG TPA: hypothetical protein VKX41_15175 [Alloacidobacterium sp.]|jgi:hypothetical protein|nr:hypothetical protein [Alloacidobacterium sp.]